MPLKFEQFRNNAQSTLTSAINDTVTSLAVDSAGLFPTDGNFTILVDTEIMLVTAVSGTTFTVQRGYGTSQTAAHDAGAVAILILTRESFTRLAADHIPWFSQEGEAGPLNSLTDSTGSAVTSASFAWTNQGTSTVSDIGSNPVVGIKLLPQLGTGSNLRVLSKTAPATPYILYGALSANLTMETGPTHMGLCWRESATGKVKIAAIAGRINGGNDEPVVLLVGNYTNPTTFSAWDITQEYAFDPVMTWFKLEADGTNLKISVSSNGLEFQEVLSEPKATFFTTAPDQIGIYVNQNSATVQSALLLNHWSEQ